MKLSELNIDPTLGAAMAAMEDPETLSDAGAEAVNKPLALHTRDKLNGITMAVRSEIGKMAA